MPETGQSKTKSQIIVDLFLTFGKICQAIFVIFIIFISTLKLLRGIETKMFRRPVHPGKVMEIAARRLKVAELYQQRYNQVQISKMLGVCNATICNDIQAIHKDWKESRLDLVEEIRLRELADLDDMERICILRLEDCKDPRTGSRWMEERRKIKEARAKLLGLNSAQKYEISKKLTLLSKEERDQGVLAALGFRANPLQLPQTPPQETVPDADTQEAEYEMAPVADSPDDEMASPVDRILATVTDLNRAKVK